MDDANEPGDFRAPEGPAASAGQDGWVSEEEAAPSGGERRSLWDAAPDDGTSAPAASAPPVAVTPVAVAPTPPRKNLAVMRNVLFAVVGLVILGLVFSLGPLLRQSEIVELEISGRLALLPLVNETGSAEHDWLAVGWTEMVGEALSRTPGVDVIPPQEMARAAAVRGLHRDGDSARERLRGLAFALGADLVLDGVVRRRGSRGAELRPLSGTAEPPLRLEFQLLRENGEEAVRSEVLGDDAIELANLLVVSLGRGLSSHGEPVRVERVYSSSVFLDQLYGLGLTALRQANPAEAVQIFELIHRQDRQFLQATLGILESRMALADCDDACQGLARKLLEQAQAQGDFRVESRALMVLARLEALADRGPAARELLRQSASVLPEAASRDHLRVQAERARLALLQDDRDEAKALFAQQLIAERSTGNDLAQASTLFEIGSLELGLGQMDDAAVAFEQALDLARQRNDPWLEARAVSSLGEVARRQGEHQRAVQLWEEALAFYRRPEDRRRRLLLLHNLAELALAERRFGDAEDQLHEIRDLASELELPEAEAGASLRLAWIMLRTGYPRQAREPLERTLELDRWITDERLYLQRVIAWFAYEEGNYRLAFETQQEVKGQAGEAWNSVDEGFHDAFRRAVLSGQRVPVPGEDGAVGASE